MKNLIACCVLFLSGIMSHAATWTFHGVKDNYSAVVIQNANPVVFASWEFVGDFYEPQYACSGAQFWNGSSWSDPTGYSDTISFSVSDECRMTCWVVSGPYPDYEGWYLWSVPFWSEGMTPGEYWIDFALDGTARINTTQPSDFGKWAWDGTINPSWVEPVSLKGKGHTKRH